MTEQIRRPLSRVGLGDSIAGLSGLAYGAFVVWWFVSGRHVDGPASIVGLAYLPLGMVAALLSFRLSTHLSDDSPRLAWRLLAVAAVLSAGAEAIAATATGAVLSPVVRGAALLVAYPVGLLAFLLLVPSARRVRDHWAFGIDAAVVAIGGAMVIWQLVLRGALGATAGPERFLMMGRATGDVLVLLGLAALLLRCPRGARRFAVLALALSQALLLTADLVLIGQPAVGHLHHAIRTLYFVLLIVAAGIEYRRLAQGAGEDDDSVRGVTALPYGAAMIGCATIVGAAARGDFVGLSTLAVPAVAVTALLLLRLFLAAAEIVRLRRERTTLASEARFRSLVQRAADMIYVVDSTWTITFASPSVPEALGYRTSHLVGTSMLDLVHPEDVPDTANRLRECLNDPLRYIRGRWRMRRNDQTFIHTETICSNLVDDDNIRGVVLTARDVSERVSLEDQLTHQAFHDPLTGLANRALFQDRVQHALARRRSDQGRLGVVYIDLDHFKAVNDKLGHAGGDALLRAAAQRLASGLRAFDTAARLGGDEFAVLVDGILRDDEVIQVAERVARAFRDPFVFDGREVTTSASVGVALSTTGQTAEDLLRNADLAMYLAKTRGRGQAALYESGMHAAATTRQEIQHDLRYALERGELSLAYQPIHVFDTQSIIGAEALLRWVHPSRGPIPPATFVPIAEESGLMVEIGRWVLKKACLDAQAWRTRAGRGLPLRVWINLSARQLPQGDLYEHVEQAIAESGIAASAIVLELTERMLLQHEEQTLELMHRLKGLGIRLAIDDFGTGYSSLSHLQRLPIDILKIDRVFVDAIASDEHASALARTVVSLGESMSLQIVAEGIENAEQAERLQALGCDGGQGFFFGMPMSADDLAKHAERVRTFSEV